MTEASILILKWLEEAELEIARYRETADGYHLQRATKLLAYALGWKN
jgi:hypothetical protein